MNVEQAMRALAADDAAVQVPPHVDAAVMSAWAECRRQDGREPAARDRRTALAWAFAAVFAVSLVAIAVAIGVLVKSRAQDEPRQALRQGVRQPSLAPGVPESVAGADAPTGSVKPQPMASRRARQSSVAAFPMDPAYVLVPDVEVYAPSLTMMRVRMPRSAFSRLGVPIANPDGDGMVDVEVLVGEDGVARSIRRAEAVGWVDTNR